jgi:hypothetical protein
VGRFYPDYFLKNIRPIENNLQGQNNIISLYSVGGLSFIS